MLWNYLKKFFLWKRRRRKFEGSRGKASADHFKIINPIKLNNFKISQAAP